MSATVGDYFLSKSGLKVQPNVHDLFSLSRYLKSLDEWKPTDRKNNDKDKFGSILSEDLLGRLNNEKMDIIRLIRFIEEG